jgi:hypothetical protein
MRLLRLLLYVIAVLVGLYLMAAVVYVIPMLSGLLDVTMEVRTLIVLICCL